MGPTLLDSWANVIKDGLTAVAVPVTAWVAVRGLNTWQRQMVGAAEFELMRNVLRAVFKVRNVLRAARAPYADSREGAELVSDNPSRPLTALERSMLSRWEKVTVAMAELDIAINEAEVEWGAEAREKLQLLNKPFFQLRTAFENYIEIKRDGPQGLEERKAVAQIRRVVYFTGGEDDSFDKDLNDAVHQIESYVRGKLKDQVKVKSFNNRHDEPSA